MQSSMRDVWSRTGAALPAVVEAIVSWPLGGRGGVRRDSLDLWPVVQAGKGWPAGLLSMCQK